MTDKLGQLIGRGREAEIYAWGEDQVLKLFYPSVSRIRVEVEATAARVAEEAGVGTPAVGETIEVDGRYGVVFERVDGPSMLAHLTTHPWQLPRLARQLAELHAAIHACKAPNLASLKDEIRGWIEGADADAGLKEAVLRRVEPLPDGDSLCHGDFHPDNVIMSLRGPMVIDWSAGRRGHPLADVARTWLISRLSVAPADWKGRWTPLLKVLRTGHMEAADGGAPPGTGGHPRRAAADDELHRAGLRWTGKRLANSMWRKGYNDRTNKETDIPIFVHPGTMLTYSFSTEEL
jgi:uncharacterized protein (TIGR02172 family)